jgi:hypothetical protein
MIKYIGFPTIRNLMQCAGPDARRYFVSDHREFKPGYPNGKLEYSLTVQTIAAWDGDVVLYWRFAVNSVLTKENKVMDEANHERVINQCDSVRRAAREWLTAAYEGRIAVYDGAIATPEGMDWLAGMTGTCLQFDERSDSYRAGDPAPAAWSAA